ncbi:hypothetical protein HY490_04305 [Candidatus Woesearchaeota archaeon]|nr:hypothetical protein [Candidatus Woesearchaeota archaeon]
MSFIQHNVNFGLMFLILLATTMLVGATVFFQVKYDQVVTDYNQQADLLDDLADELQFHQSALGKVNDALKVAQEREAALGQITARISAERQRIARNPIRANDESPTRLPVRKNPEGVTVNSAFASRPNRASTSLNGWGAF